MRVVTAGSEGAADESTPDCPHRAVLYNDSVLSCAYNQPVMPEDALCARANQEQTHQNEHASCRNSGNRENKKERSVCKRRQAMSNSRKHRGSAAPPSCMRYTRPRHNPADQGSLLLKVISAAVVVAATIATGVAHSISQDNKMASFGVERQARWSLEGKTALVTGGTKGIGKAVVEELACLGASVLTCSRTVENVEACVEEWKAKGLNVRGTAADVSTPEGREALLKLADEHFGGMLDILVNNVGTNIRKATVDFTAEEFSTIMDTNFNSIFFLTQLMHPLLKAAAAAKGVKERGGSSVVNISSVAGLTAIKSGESWFFTYVVGTPYAATKSAINRVTKNWGCEWAPDGIRVNAVAPWYTYTPLTESVQADPERRAIIQRTPMGRWADPDEVSGVVAFLCMKCASYITSQVIAVDGGFTANGWMT
ncbi:unnamed protein product [Ascophyllum nodosum]